MGKPLPFSNNARKWMFFSQVFPCFRQIWTRSLLIIGGKLGWQWLYVCGSNKIAQHVGSVPSWTAMQKPMETGARWAASKNEDLHWFSLPDVKERSSTKAGNFNFKSTKLLQQMFQRTNLKGAFSSIRLERIHIRTHNYESINSFWSESSKDFYTPGFQFTGYPLDATLQLDERWPLENISQQILSRVLQKLPKELPQFGQIRKSKEP